LREYRSDKLRHVSRAEVVALKKSGLSDELVAKRYGVSQDRVRQYRRKHHIAGIQGGFRGGDEALRRPLTVEAEIAMLAVDRYREDELFAGLRFTDSPAASRREGMFRGNPSSGGSTVGCAAAWCTDNA